MGNLIVVDEVCAINAHQKKNKKIKIEIEIVGAEDGKETEKLRFAQRKTSNNIS